MAVMAGRVLDLGCDVVAAVPWRASMPRDGADHQRGHQQGQVDHAYLEEIARDRAALGVGGGAQDAREADGVREIEEAESGRGKCVDGAGHSETPGSEAYRDHDDCVEERFDNSGEAVRLDDWQHANAGARVVVAVEPGNGHEVRELPDEEDCEESDGRPLDAAAGGGPSEERAHGAGKCADEGGEGGYALERRVDGHIAKCSEQEKRHGEEVGVEKPKTTMPPRAESCDAREDALGERDATCGDGSVGCTLHEGIAGTFERLIERSGSGGDQADTDEGVEEAALKTGDSRLHGAEIKACPSGDYDHTCNADLEEFAHVRDEGSGDAGAGSVDRVRRVTVDRFFAESGVVHSEIGGAGSLGSRSHKCGEDLNEGTETTGVPTLMILTSGLTRAT